jgi:hypothetical protein
VLLRDDLEGPGAGTLHCYLQVNNDIPTGTGPGTSGHGTGLVSAGPAQITYVATATDNVYLCSEFTDDYDGTTYYWDDVNGEWSTSAATPCGLATSTDGDPSALLQILCPVTALLFPPEGDVPPILDCPPPPPA